jgi:monoamine oxidase
MEGSWQLEGGLAAITEAHAGNFSSSRTRPNARVETLTRVREGISAALNNGDILTADSVVLALPPRIAAEITFSPPLPLQATQAMQSVKTRIAGQAKAVAVYGTAFWRESGLSGNASSRFGPMVEIHDISEADGGPYALFGFIGVSPEGRSDEQLLRQHLVRTRPPKQIKRPLCAPKLSSPAPMTKLWGAALLFDGTEVALKGR